MNKFEDKIENVLAKYGNIQLNFEGESVIAMQVMKQASDKNKLFKRACSPYPSPKARQKQTEFVYQSPVNDIDWRIECKSRQTESLIGEITHELNFVAKIPEKLYCLVLTKNLVTPYILGLINQNIAEKGLESKVWVGTKKQFKNLLKESQK